MFDIDEHRPLRGSVNSSSTNIVQQGLMDALIRLFALAITVWRDRPRRDVSETDELDAGSLARGCHQKLVGIPELTEPTTDVSELRERFQTLQQLRAKKPSRLLRDVESAAREATLSVVERVRNAIDGEIGAGPHRTKAIIEQVRAGLQTVHLPEPDPEPLTRFGRVIRGLVEIGRHRSTLPTKTFEYVEQQLSQRALPLYDEALLALAGELVVVDIRRELAELDVFLDELSGRGHDFARNLSEVEAALEELRSETLRASRQSRASVLLEIAGATESEILAGLLARQKCQDQRELVEVLLQKWEADLRVRAAGWLPPTATLGTLLTHISPKTIADSFQSVVEGSLGEGHTLYEMIERSGIARTALDLYERAEQLCHLRSRDIEPFNITPCKLTIVRLPQPVGRRDGQIREELARAFSDLCRQEHCAVIEAPNSERHVVSVIRASMGWPIGIEAGNTVMLLAYAAAHERGHMPHLAGVFDESPDGSALPSYLEMAPLLEE
ncbi:MAG: hypothetical protein KDA93_16910 [Planctomycetaceae bacterium]|nr:hypothetical protein [Planctomycetaceae bacterium]